MQTEKVYSIFGFTYIVDTDIAALKDYEIEKPDLTLPIICFRKGFINNAFHEAKFIYDNEIAFSVVSDTEMRVELRTGGRFQITKGLVIYEDADEIEILTNLVGPITYFESRLFNRCIFFFYSFIFNNKAYLLVGVSGTGKSTLSSALSCYQKVLLYADDLLCVSSSGKEIFNGFRVAKLLPDSMNTLFHSPEDEKYIKLNPFDEAKRIYTGAKIGNLIEKYMYPIQGVFFLDPKDTDSEIHFRSLTKIEYFSFLSRSRIFRAATTTHVLAQDLEIISNMTSNSWGIELSLKRDFSYLPNATDAIMDFINNHE